MEEDREEKQAEEEEVGSNPEDKLQRRRGGSGNNNRDSAARGSCGGERGEFSDSRTQTLATAKVSESDLQLDVTESSEVLSDVPVEYYLQPQQLIGGLKDSVRAVDTESSLEITEQSENLQIQAFDRPSMLEASSASVTKSVSSTKSPTLPDKKMQLEEQDRLNSQSPKPLSAISMTRNSDGYNWRKYGQKQVKSPEGSRSYYRCTFSNCHAKKIECCCHSNHAIETVYRSEHNHDPPPKLNCARENRHVLPIISVNGNKDAGSPSNVSSDPVPSASSKEHLLIAHQKPESKQQESCGSDETAEIDGNEDHADGSERKRRQKGSSSGEVASLPTHGKKPKFVVHAAGDVGMTGDGYRWRKYGQKMVKGNPHPRNYYRCTSPGCPVRKHIERALDSTTSVVITYKGVHDHDMPVPTKHLRPKCAPVGSVNNLKQHPVDPCDDETQWSVNREGGLTAEALNPGGEKTSEPRRTLLSIGFEIKPC